MTNDSQKLPWNANNDNEFDREEVRDKILIFEQNSKNSLKSLKSKGKWLHLTSKSKNLPGNAKIDNAIDRRGFDDQNPNSNKNSQIHYGNSQQVSAHHSAIQYANLMGPRRGLQSNSLQKKIRKRSKMSAI